MEGNISYQEGGGDGTLNAEWSVIETEGRKGDFSTQASGDAGQSPLVNQALSTCLQFAVLFWQHRGGG